jgi:hypothetical protein
MLRAIGIAASLSLEDYETMKVRARPCACELMWAGLCHARSFRRLA